MAEPYTSRSRGSGNVSRAFTDTENELDDRINSVMSMPITLSPGRTVGETYHWLKEDMAMRGALTQQLAAEQRVAYEQSMRHELAKDAQEDQDDDALAQEGARIVNGYLSSGAARDPQEAISRAVMENPKLALSRRFGDFAKVTDSYFKSDDQRKMEDAKRNVDMLQLGNQEFDLNAMREFRDRNPQAMDDAVAIIGNKIKEEGVNSSTRVLAANIASYEKQKEWDDIKANTSLWGGMSFSDDPAQRKTQMSSYIDLRGSMRKAGLGAVTAPDKLIKEFSDAPEILEMLGNTKWMNERFSDEDRTALAGAANLITDPAADPVRRQEAVNILADYASDHKTHIAEAKTFDSQVQGFQKLQADRSDLFKNFTKQLSDSIDIVEDETGQLTRQTMKGAYQNFFMQYMAGLPQGDPSAAIAEKYLTKVEEFDKGGDAANARAKATRLIREFSGEVWERNKSSFQRPSAKPAGPGAPKGFVYDPATKSLIPK